MDLQIIALVVVTILLLVAGGWIKRLLGEIKDLVDAVVLALEDNEVSKEEILEIMGEAKDVGRIAVEIYQLLSQKWDKLLNR